MTQKYPRDSERVKRAAADALASSALTAAAKRLAVKTTGTSVTKELLDRLETALFAGAREDRLAIIDDMRRAGIDDNTIVDTYIPDVARQLGAEWCEDQRSFAEVTIGTANLQSLLHDIAIDWCCHTDDDGEDFAAMIIVRDDEYHTLGAMIFAAQLRREGVDVTVCLGRDDAEILSEARFGDYDFIGFSASEGEDLDRLGELMVSIRKTVRKMPMIALGGSLLATRTVGPDLGKICPADYVGISAKEAVELCRKQNQSRPASNPVASPRQTVVQHR